MRSTRARVERVTRRSCSHCPACKDRRNPIFLGFDPSESAFFDDFEVLDPAVAMAPCKRCGRVPRGLWLGYDPEVAAAERRE